MAMLVDLGAKRIGRHIYVIENLVAAPLFTLIWIRPNIFYLVEIEILAKHFINF